MKLSYAIFSSLFLYSSKASLLNDSKLVNVGEVIDQRQREEIQATFNIYESQQRDAFKNLGDDEPFKALIKTKRRRGSVLVKNMSLKVDMEIKRAGILGATITKKEMRYLEQHQDIERIEPDYEVYALGDSTNHLRKLVESTPYGIDMVLQDRNFWKNRQPSGSIKVCVADTGYDRGHVDLPKGQNVKGTSNPEYGENWYQDGHGHGTHCSGTVAALGNNNEGVVGVIPNNVGQKFQLVIANALTGSGSGSSSGVLKAVETCVADGAKVVSLSLGGSPYSQITENFYNNLYENEGILFVAAAGNGGTSSKLYPASYPALMSVAAVDSNKDKASFSQYNDQVEISAPGVAVRSTLPNDQYASWSGTSMATPHVAGVAGLLWMHFPECKNYQIRNVLVATAEDLGAADCDRNYGYGLVQAKDAYDLLSEGNCGGNIGETSPVGGCEQLFGEPECSSNSDCDDGNACTIDTCANGRCEVSFQCAACGKSEVEVEITTDSYGEDVSFEITDNDGNTMMEGDDYTSSATRTDYSCLGQGSYTFTIYDSYGDGLCCSYGDGSYSVKVDDKEVASGAEYTDFEAKDFNIGQVSSSFAPTSSTSQSEPTPSQPTPSQPTPYPTETPPTPHPTHRPPTMFPTHRPPTMFPTKSTPTCGAKGDACKRKKDCCSNICRGKNQNRKCR